MSAKALATKLDWQKISEYFLPKTKIALQSFLSEYNKVALELTELNMRKTSVDLAHYEKVLSDSPPVAEARKILQNFQVKEMPVSDYLDAIVKSENTAKEALEASAEAAKSELATFEKVVKNIEDSRDFLELEAKDIKHIFKDKADRVLDIHMMGYDTLPEFRKKYGDFNITG